METTSTPGSQAIAGAAVAVPVATLEAILDLARWAPSTDNTQPWRFEISRESNVAIHAFDTRQSCVYDLDGRVSQLSVGTLLETIRIAASAHGLDCRITRRPDSADSHPVFDVRFIAASLGRDPLCDFIEQRSVQRRPMRTRPLTADEQRKLEAAVGKRYRVRWLESFSGRLALARILFSNGRLRLKLPEAFDVHRQVIDWGASESTARMPDRAIGLDPISLRITRWAMASWNRLSFLDRYLAGTLVPALELDFVPGLACAGHFVIVAPSASRTLDDYIDAGRALQRFWLTATSLGLMLQPEASPLVFARYVREGRRFTSSESCERRCREMVQRLTCLIGEDVLGRAVFMGRIGTGTPPKARSTRLPLDQLYVS